MDLTLYKRNGQLVSQPQQSSHRYEFGQIISATEPEKFYLADSDLSVHSCVLGQSGSGKSKFLELLMRYLTVSRKGFALIDPHGDLSEDLLAYAAYQKAAKHDENILSRIHYIEPTYEQIFHYDPFRFRPRKPIAPEHLEKAVESWLHAKADRVSEVFLRKQGKSSFEGMTRLQRMMRNVLVAVGTSVNGNGQHLPLSDALVLLDVNHTRHFDVFNRVAPHLEKDVLSDFNTLHNFKQLKDVRLETESTINWMRSLLSPIVKSIFADHVHTIDFPSIVENGEILLVNLRETDYFSGDQAKAIGGLFIHEILAAAQNAPREMRKPYHLIIDEAADYIGDDVQRALGIMRKFKLSVCLAAQDLSSFKKIDLDLRPKVLSQCGTIVSFRQSWPDDLDILSRVMCTGNIDFTKHYQIVDRPDGYKIMEIDEYGEQFTWGTSTAEGFATSESSSTSRQESESTSHNDSWSRTDTHSDSHTDSRSSSKSESSTKNTHSENEQRTEGRQTGSGSSDMTGTSHGSTTGGSSGFSSGTSVGQTRGTSNSKNTSSAKNESQGKSASHRKVPLAQHREESQETPQLLNSVADQLERFKSGLHRLDVGQAIVKLRSQQQAIVVQTTTVVEKWHGPQKHDAIERMKQRVFESRPYCGPPAVGPDQDDRLAKYVNGHAHQSAEQSPHFP